MTRRNMKMAVAAGILGVICSAPPSLHAITAVPMQDQPAAVTRVLGTVAAVNGNTLTVKPDHGQPIEVSVTGTTRVLRLQPGQKKLSDATPIQIGDVAAGDRVLISAQAGDGGALTARLVVAMKQSDIAQRQQAEEAAWQRLGVGGIVKSVDPATSTIVILSGARSLTIKTSPSTSVRRYASDSVAFKDAQPSTIAEIHPGDQLRARGDHSADGSEVNADAIVFGSFRNIAGLVLSVNPAAQTLTVQDLVTKKPVTLHVNSDSQLHKLDPNIAETVAMHLKAASAGQHAERSSSAATSQAEDAPRDESAEHEGNGAAGFSGILQHSPAIQLSGLHKGDAVMVVATPGSASEPGTAVTLLAGVEPMLRASASASQSMFSSSWSLGGGAAAGGDSGDAGQQQ